MKKAGLAGGGVTLKLKTADFRTVTRARRLSAATQSADEMFRAAAPLLAREADGRAFRLIGIGAHALIQAGEAVEAGEAASKATSSAAPRLPRTRSTRRLTRCARKFGEDAIARGRGFGTKLVRQGPSKVE